MDSVQQLSPCRTVVTSFSPRQKPKCATSDSAFEEGDWVLCLAVSGSDTTTTTSTDGSCGGGGSTRRRSFGAALSINSALGLPDNNRTDAATISCALSNGEVQVYDQQRLHVIASFTPGTCNNQNLITDLIYGPHREQTLIVTAQDGSVVVTDLRQNQSRAAIQTNIRTRAGCNDIESALSIDLGFDGNIAAVASNKSSIHFLDLRSGGNLGSYRNSHTNAITKVRFHTEQRSILLSAGEDGLVCCFDTSQATEELAFQSVLNIGAPLRQIGFCDKSTIYCLTGNETASLWDINTMTCRQDFGGMNLRHDLSQQTISFRRGKHEPQQYSSMASSTPAVHMDDIQYLVDAHWDTTRRELLLCAGNGAGDAALFGCSDGVQWRLYNTMVGGHRGVVRAWQYLPTKFQLFTVGEDARFCEWNRLGGIFMRQLGGNQNSVATNSVIAARSVMTSFGPGGGPVRRQRRHSHKPSTAPY